MCSGEKPAGNNPQQRSQGGSRASHAAPMDGIYQGEVSRRTALVVTADLYHIPLDGSENYRGSEG